MKYLITLLLAVTLFTARADVVLVGVDTTGKPGNVSTGGKTTNLFVYYGIQVTNPITAKSVTATNGVLAASDGLSVGATAPVASAVVDLTSTTKGLLIPRMTATQRGNISSPATGLLVYQTDSPIGFYYYNGGAWVYLKDFQSVSTIAQTLVTSSTTLTDISGLTLPLAAGSFYAFEAYVPFSTTGATSGYKIGPAFSGTQTTFNWVASITSNTAALTNGYSQTLVGASAAGTYGYAVRGAIYVSVAGNIKIQIAQKVSDAANISVEGASGVWLKAWPIYTP